MFKTSAFEPLYGGKFTLSTQLFKPNYLTMYKFVFARKLIIYIQIILVSLTYIVLIWSLPTSTSIVYHSDLEGYVTTHQKATPMTECGDEPSQFLAYSRR